LEAHAGKGRVAPPGTSGTLNLRSLLAFRLPAVLLLAFSFNSSACEPGKPAVEKDAPVYGYEVVHTYQHDPDAFTQGLVFTGGNLLESTGEEGHSSLRRVELQAGTVVQRVDVPRPYFAEGITLLKGKIHIFYLYQNVKNHPHDQLPLTGIYPYNHNLHGQNMIEFAMHNNRKPGFLVQHLHQGC